ncbi:MAG TPA: roadblock/LC7 domain-containing protein [Trueperaceae bacterium]|nr:roadblock/LC7 domain-containing protein [Trueperaceae bacterium]
MQDLEEILGQLVEGVDGALAAAVAGMDGLVIEQHPRESTELAAVVAELTNALKGLQLTVGEHLGGGAMRELIVTSERRIGYARLLEGDLFCLLVLNRHGNLGKARLLTAETERKIQGAFA